MQLDVFSVSISGNLNPSWQTNVTLSPELNGFVWFVAVALATSRLSSPHAVPDTDVHVTIKHVAIIVGKICEKDVHLWQKVCQFAYKQFKVC